jgi:hypothetical protein
MTISSSISRISVGTCVTRKGRYDTVPLQTRQGTQYAMKQAIGLVRKFRGCHMMYFSHMSKLVGGRDLLSDFGM